MTRLGRIAASSTLVAGLLGPGPAGTEARGPEAALTGCAERACALVEGAARCWAVNAAPELGDSTLAEGAAPRESLGLPDGWAALAARGRRGPEANRGPGGGLARSAGSVAVE